MRPARAARLPNKARKSSELAVTVITSAGRGTTKMSSSGKRAPTAKEPAEAKGRLNRASTQVIRDTQLITGMRAQSIVCHELGGHLSSKLYLQSAIHINRREFGVFALLIFGQFLSLPLQVSLLRVGLRTHGYIFASSHRHSSRHQTGHPGDHHTTATGFGRRHPDKSD